MVTAWIHNHVCAFVHMAFEATGPLLCRIVEVVFPASVLSGHMAPVAKRISLDKDFPAVGFVTIFTHHPGLVHFALEKGTVYIDLFQDLAIGEIEILFEQ